MLSINGAPEIPRGSLVRVRLSGVDLMTLDIKADFIELSHSPSGAGNEIRTENELEDEFSEDFDNSPIVQSVAIDLDLDAAQNDESIEFTTKEDRVVSTVTDSSEIQP